MAITRTAKGTATKKNTTSDLHITSVSLSTGSSLIVGIMDNNGTSGPSSVTWNGNSLSSNNRTSNGTQSLSIYSIHNVTGATADIVISFGTNSVTAVAFAIQVDGLASSSTVDKTNQNFGNSASPSSGSTATTSQASEIFIGVVGTVGPSSDTAGSWGNSYSAGQRDGTSTQSATSNLTISEGYFIASSTQTTSADKTGITSRAWIALVATYKAATGSTTTMTASAASFTESGVAASLIKKPVLSAAVASVSLTGISAALAKRTTVIADQQSFAVTGIANAFQIKRNLTASVASYAITGNSVTLTKQNRRRRLIIN